MDFPQTKYQIGDELYFVNGTQCSCFKVTALNFIVLDEQTCNFQYLSEDEKTKKVIRALEPQLFATWDEAKENMASTLEKLIENTRKQLENAVDPYELPEEPPKA